MNMTEGGEMRELELHAGDHIGRACERLAAMAPAWMVFNGVRVEARAGDTADVLSARWTEEMDRELEAARAKRRAYEQTPEGMAELEAAARRAEEERRAREEVLARVEASGVRAKYAWREEMGEISGFGGGYEAACRDMLYTGLAWLEAHPEGSLEEKRGALKEVVLTACPDCSGAMHGAVVGTLLFIIEKGWDRYVAACRVDVLRGGTMLGVPGGRLEVKVEVKAYVVVIAQFVTIAVGGVMLGWATARRETAPLDAGVPAPAPPVHHEDPLPVDDPALARAERPYSLDGHVTEWHPRTLTCKADVACWCAEGRPALLSARIGPNDAGAVQ